MALINITEKPCWLGIFLSLLISGACERGDRTTVFAEYLKQEKELRERVTDEELLRDSIAELREKYGIDRDRAAWQFGDNPDQWIELLRKLRHDQ